MPRVDREVIQRLTQAGWSRLAIAQHLGCSHATVSLVARGIVQEHYARLETDELEEVAAYHQQKLAKIRSELERRRE